MFERVLLMLGYAMRLGSTLAGDAWHTIEKLVIEERGATAEEADVINAGVAAAHAVLPEGHGLKSVTVPQLHEPGDPLPHVDPAPDPTPPAPEPVMTATEVLAAHAPEPPPPPPPAAAEPAPVPDPAPVAVVEPAPAAA